MADLRVIVPPTPIIAPTDIASTNDPDDPILLALIAAATEEIDGPEGWLGRALGPQSLELVTDVEEHRRHGYHVYGRHYGIRLPCPPIIEIESIKYFDAEYVEQALDPATYELTEYGVRLYHGALPLVIWHRERGLTIRYQAGYNGTPVVDDGTGDIPARAKQAIIFSVQQLTALGAENLFLSNETVEGIGSTGYVVSPNSELLIRNTMERLLGGLRVYA